MTAWDGHMVARDNASNPAGTRPGRHKLAAGSEVGGETGGHLPVAH